MPDCFMRIVARRFSGGLLIACAALLFGACSLKAGRGPAEAIPPAAGSGPAEVIPPAVGRAESEEPQRIERRNGDLEIEDLVRIPQNLDWLAAAAGNRLNMDGACRTRLLDEFHNRFFAPWTASAPAFDPVEAADFMKQEGRAVWYGPNSRRVAARQMRQLLANCALESFPSRNDMAIAVAPAHLRGLPSDLPLYRSAEDYPFDMLSYPHVKLNEPLRVLHVSRDGVWLFVETGYTNGWLERRDVALVDRPFIDSWMRAPHLVVVRDYAPVPDGRGVGVFRSKVGTILPLAGERGGNWEVVIASAGEGGRAESRTVDIPRETAAPFPLAFDPENVARIGNQFLGEPYGWGEIYDLRDCSAMLRDFFLPFGIWLPRTSADQIAYQPQRVNLARMTPQQKEEVIREKGVPFLTLLYKPGHIMLYVGVDSEGRPLVFHDAWSIRLRDAGARGGAPAAQSGASGVKNGAAGVEASQEWTQIIGVSAITTLEPGKELGLVPGSSLLDRDTELATITSRCQDTSRPDPHPKK